MYVGRPIGFVQNYMMTNVGGKQNAFIVIACSGCYRIFLTSISTLLGQEMVAKFG